jgi:hypothetical protein
MKVVLVAADLHGHQLGVLIRGDLPLGPDIGHGGLTNILAAGVPSLMLVLEFDHLIAQ